MTVEWPVELSGITETVVTTRGPNGRFNVAALGVRAGAPVTSRTWGDTRTRRNFEREGEGYVQFTRDPVDFVEAALTVREESEPILESADAWVLTAVDRLDAETTDGTRVETWAHRPIDAGVTRRIVPTTNRGHAAVIEATVAASRLDVDAFDADALCDRLAFLESVAERCGGPREREAFALVTAVSGWKSLSSGADGRSGAEE